MVATFCAVALGPRIVVAGLPGSRWTRKKVATETKMMMMMSSTSRLRDVTGHVAFFPPFACRFPSDRAASDAPPPGGG